MRQAVIRLGAVLALGLGLAAALLWATGRLGGGVSAAVVRAAGRASRAQAAGEVYCVTPEGGTYPACTQVFTNVQAAVDAASGGETIKVAAGVYTDVHARPRRDTQTTGMVTQVVYISKTVHIVGGYTITNWEASYPVTQPTTLDARRQGRVVYVTGVPSAGAGGAISPTLEGLCITRGDAAGLGGGGGLYVISATLAISDSAIVSNTGGSGGGIRALWANLDIAGSEVVSSESNSDGGGLHLHYGDISVRSSSFLANYSGGSGGGLHSGDGDVTIIGTTFDGNRAAMWGGGVWLYGEQVTLIRSTFAHNTAPDGHGGGLGLSGGVNVISGNLFISNTAQGAGGLEAGGEAVTLTNNVILSNAAETYGGGMSLGGGLIRLVNNTIAFNSVGSHGGGLYLQDADAVLVGNTIVSNTVLDYGGGIDMVDSTVVLVDNTVVDNAAYAGGGIALRDSGLLGRPDSEGMLDSNIIAHNTSSDVGGGIYVDSSPVTLTNALIHDNQAASRGSGVYIHSWNGELARFVHSTIARNTGGDGSGIHVTDAYGAYGNVWLTNTILVSHTVGITVAAGSTARLEATLWGTDTWGNGMDWGGAGTILTGTPAHNWWAAPGFIDPDAGDYHLRADSAAIDVGVDVGVATDVDGDPRPMGAGPDLGADEAAFVDLAVTKGVTPTVAAPGDAITYTLAFSNAGSLVARGVAITDLMPVAVAVSHVVSSGVPITGTGAAYAWQVADLLPGDGGAITIAGVVSPSFCGAFSLTNQVVITTTGEDWDTTNDVAYVSSTVDGRCWAYLPLVAKE